jgi:flagellar motor switch protein FliG
MLSGPEKALLLYTTLGDRSQLVLPHLSSETVSWLNDQLDQAPSPKSEYLQELVSELNQHTPPRSRADSAAAASVSIEGGLPTLGGSSGSLFSAEEEALAPQVGEVKPPEKIALKLALQKPQIIAFVLSKVDEGLRDQIMQSLPEPIRATVSQINVGKSALSDSIFQSIYSSLFLYTETDLEEASSATDTLDSEGFSLSSGLLSEEPGQSISGFSSPLWENPK